LRSDARVQGKAADGEIWYYREQAANPDAVAMSVIQMVVKHKLGISMSSKPDYSDYLDGKGVPHPTAAAGPPIDRAAVPEVTPCDALEQVFTNVRETAAGSKGDRGLVVVAPNRQLLLVPALEPSKKLNEVAAVGSGCFPPP
jgi:hypothetical protein